MAYTIQQEASALLKDLGAPQTPQMMAAAEAWLSYENGVGNNPLGVTSGSPSHLNQYATPLIGIQAAANLLFTGNHGYSTVVARARAGDSVGFLNALAASGWNAPSHYGTASGGSNVLYGIYARILTNTYHIPTANSQGGAVSKPTGITLASSTSDPLALAQGIITDIQIQLTLGGGGVSNAGSLHFDANGANTTVAQYLGIDPSTDYTAGVEAQLLKKLTADFTSGKLSPGTSGQAGQFSGPNFDLPAVGLFIAVVLVGLTFIILGGFLVKGSNT